jgi:MFS transporter, OFA family, oxalate/formate antiporter
MVCPRKISVDDILYVLYHPPPVTLFDTDDLKKNQALRQQREEEIMSVASTVGADAQASATTRWTQLAAVILCMVMIANLQYSWTYFVNPMKTAHQAWGLAAIQSAFAIFIALETWLTPIEGWIVDMLGPRTGPRLMVALGGILVGLGWYLNSVADSLDMLYLGAVVSGIGGGAVYATSVGHAVKWFPDRRGLAVGLTAAGYGGGASLSVLPIQYVIHNYGYQEAFFWFALLQGGVVFVLAWLLRGPEEGDVPRPAAPKVIQTSKSYRPAQVLTSPIFWLLYVMFVMVSGSGLVVTAQLGPIAKDFGVEHVLLFGVEAFSLAGIIDGIANGGARPLFGWVSDHIGREYTMAVAFALGAVAYWLLQAFGMVPVAFVAFAAAIYLTWGEIFSLFPSTCADSFGPRFATVNLGLLYTAKGASAVFTPLANLIKDATGSWHLVFVLATIMNLAVVVLALFVLRPLRRRLMEKA